MNHDKNNTSRILVCASAFWLLAAPASAQVTQLPGPADIDRVNPMQNSMPPMSVDEIDEFSPRLTPLTPPPEGAKDITFVLKGITIEGGTVYSDKELAAYYEEYLGKTIALDKIWEIAAAITEQYRADGYFLSRAYVPAQETGNGRMTIRIAEGYVDAVEVPPAVEKSSAVKSIIAKITAERPTRLRTLERQHLLLRDLPGMANYQGTLTSQPKGDGAVKLIFSERKGKTRPAFISFDNYGSRYLGPHEVTAGWRGALVPMQETSITAAVSLPTKKLGAVNLTHRIPLREDVSLDLAAGYTTSEPGYTLAPQEIESKAVNTGVGVTYQAIRQRRENLQLGASIDARNSKSTILNSTLSKDKVRAARLKATYDRTDNWQGYNAASATLSRGIDGLGSSKANDANLSRAGAKPDFTKLELEYKRLQMINADWSGLLALSGQKASGSLYSSEEFGFGGQSFGRAYDQSEITGDEGVAASLEMRYHGVPSWHAISMMPYGFYDIGKVWNRNSSQTAAISASSAGLGMRLNHENGMSGSLQMAVPMTKDRSAPIYGNNGANPRLGVQFGYAF